MKHNGNDIKLSPLDYVRLTLIIVTTIGTGVFGWANLSNKVNANAESVAEACQERESLKKVVREQSDNVLTMQGDIIRMQVDVSELKAMTEELKKISYQILGKINN